MENSVGLPRTAVNARLYFGNVSRDKSALKGEGEHENLMRGDRVEAGQLHIKPKHLIKK